MFLGFINLSESKLLTKLYIEKLTPLDGSNACEVCFCGALF